LKKIKILVLTGLADGFECIFKQIFEENTDFKKHLELDCLDMINLFINLYHLYEKEKDMEATKINSIPPGKGFYYCNQLKKKEEITPLYIYSDEISQIIFEHKPNLILFDLFIGSIPFINLDTLILLKHIIIKFNERCRKENHNIISEIMHFKYYSQFYSIFNCNDYVDNDFKSLADTNGIIKIDNSHDGGISYYKASITQFIHKKIIEKFNNIELILK